MISTSNNKRVANAVGGKTARACDSCIKKRARWYCAADDAFLCQACDSSVHSANPLARRHERVRLKTASFKSLDSLVAKGVTKWSRNNDVPSWHRRKARTPRHGKSYRSGSPGGSINLLIRSSSLHVPELGSDVSNEENEEDIEQQLLYRVPIFDPFVAEFCNSTVNNNNTNNNSGGRIGTFEENNCVANSSSDRNGKGGEGLLLYGVSEKEGEVEEEEEEEESLKGFLAPEMDLAEFAADVESLLGRGLEEEPSFGMEELGLVIGGCKEENKQGGQYLGRSEPMDCSPLVESSNGKVKVEETNDTEIEGDGGGDNLREGMTLDLGFDYDEEEMSPGPCSGGGDEEEEEEVVVEEEEEDKKGILGIGYGTKMKDDPSGVVGDGGLDKKKNNKRKEVLLRLDYEAVISTWGAQGGSPWTTGSRPDFDPDECWPDCLSICGAELQQLHGEHKNGPGGGRGGGHPAILGDGGREARVSRYREKRRSRLFSKKIRYEVRKLNAEKRPRMKGRFVKRATFSGPTFPSLNK